MACHQKNGDQANNTSNNIKPKTDSVLVDSLTAEIRKHPKNDKLYALRAGAYLDMGEMTKAINDLTIANKLDSLNPEYYIRLSDFYLQLGKSELTNQLLLKANRLIPENKEVLYRLGNLYFYVQDYKKAFEYINKAIDIDPFYAEAYFTKALVYREIKDTTRAIRQLQIATEREPDYYDAYMLLGDLFSQKNDSIAIDYYNNALQIIPNSYEAHYGKAMFYQQSNQPRKAIKRYQTMVDSLNRNKNMLYYNIAYVYMQHLNDYNQAISYYDSAIQQTPDFAEAYLNKGYCFEQLRQYQKARQMYTKVLEMQPNMELAILGLNRLDNK